MGVAGIALATGIAGWVQFTLLFRGLKGQTAVQFDDRLRFVFPRIVGSGMVMAVVVFVIAQVLGDWFIAESSLKKLLALGILIGGGAGVYALGIQFTGALTIADLKKYLKRKDIAADMSVSNDQ